MPFVEPALQKDGRLYEVCVFEHEDDVQLLYEGYLGKLRRCRNLVVDFTSGTKAMSAAVFAAAIAVEAATVSYVIGPRDSTGRVTESTDVASLYPQRVLAERQLDRARDLFNRLDFHAAVQLADPYRRSLPDDLEGVCGRCILRQRCLGNCVAENYHQARRLTAAYWFCQQAEQAGLFPTARLQ